MRRRRGFIGLLGAIFLIGAAAFVALAWYPEMPGSEPPPKSAFDHGLISRGAQLSLIGNCNVCHTKPGGAPYAGGRPMATPFGTIYATNITPDPETGIGRWSEAAFRRSMHEGVRRDGAHLYPAFPYDHFTKVSAQDVRAIYAFLMTREPVYAKTPPNELPFPLNLRPLIAAWKLLYFQRGEFKPDSARSAELNRGAYLVEGLAHCGACHTPRNAFGAERHDQYFAGGESEGWHAPALNAASPAPIPWTTEQLSTYLQQGFVERHGVAAGPMQPVTGNLGDVPEQDVKAIAAYVGTILEPATAERQARANELQARVDNDNATAAPAGDGTTGSGSPAGPDGAVVYAGACAFCHERAGQGFSAHGIHLALSKVVALPDPRNLIHVILDGIEPPPRAPAAFMPGFGEALTNAQVAALVAYLRANFSNQPAWSDVEEQVRKIRQTNKG
jgi:mono/diheme cytochrome c family protein